MHKNKRLQIVDQTPLDPLTYSPCFLIPKLKVLTRSKCTMFFLVVSIEIGQFFCYTLIANVADHAISDSDRKAREP